MWTWRRSSMQVMYFMDAPSPSCILRSCIFRVRSHLAWLGDPPNRAGQPHPGGHHDPIRLRTQRRQGRRETPAGPGAGGGTGGDLSGFGPGQCHPAAALESGPLRQTERLTRRRPKPRDSTITLALTMYYGLMDGLAAGNDSSYFLKPS